MILEVRAVAPFYKNGFVVGCERTREAVIIDPGDEVDQLVGGGTRPGCRRQADPADPCARRPRHRRRRDQGRVQRPRSICTGTICFSTKAPCSRARMFGFKVRQPPPVDSYYDGTPIYFGDYDVRVHHTPGHCPGGVCLQIGRRGRTGQHLFVGDTLFAGSIGRTDLPGGDYEVLMESITKVLFPLGDEAIVHPGHGPDTTIRRERTTNHLCWSTSSTDDVERGSFRPALMLALNPPRASPRARRVPPSGDRPMTSRAVSTRSPLT